MMRSSVLIAAFLAWAAVPAQGQLKEEQRGDHKGGSVNVLREW